MLDLKITIEGHKVVIKGLLLFSPEIKDATRRGLTRIGAGVFDGAYYWLRGPSRSKTRIFTKKKGEEKKDYYQTGKRAGMRKRTSSRGRTESLEAAPGSYPVPRVTSHLLQRLAWLKPGKAKSAGGHTFFAGPDETVIYNSADYAETIFGGKGTSAPYGPRDALKDGLARFNQGNKINDILEEEIHKKILNFPLSRG